MTTALAYVAHFRKALVTAIGVATAILSMSVLPEQYATYVSTGIGIATAVLTYVVPNVEKAIEQWDDEEYPDYGIPASQLIEELEAEVAVPTVELEAQVPVPGPELPAEVALEAPPTQDTPEFVQPDTATYAVDELLDALGHKAP